MLENLKNLWDLLLASFEWVISVLFSNALTVGGFILAIVIILKIFREQRRPSSILAWSFFIIAFPFLGAPLYLLVGGRKLKKKIQAKGLLTDSRLTRDSSIRIEDLFQTTGNKVDFITDGQIAYRNFCQHIKDAEKEIHILTYILGDEKVGNSILDLLIEKVSQGVRVRLLIDALGSFHKPTKKLKAFKAAGGEFFTFMPAFPLQTHGWANLRNHRKIAIFDNRVGILGGRNLDGRFMGADVDADRFYDFGASYEGPVVEYLNGVFLADWAFASKQPLDTIDSLAPAQMVEIGASAVTGIASGPDVPGDMLYERLINIIQEFESTLVIVTPYFIPDEVLLRSLIVKARRGKKVTLILPEKSNWTVVDVVRGQYLRELHQAGVRILLFQAGMLHSKLLVADNKLLLHGSANFDIRSLFVNFEIGMIHTSLEDLEQVSVWLNWLEEKSRAFGLQRELNPPRLRKTFEDIARLIAPLL
jgi:cardiolipin synthase A/B